MHLLPLASSLSLRVCCPLRSFVLNAKIRRPTHTNCETVSSRSLWKTRISRQKALFPPKEPEPL
jgi:hypothetical protein